MNAKRVNELQAMLKYLATTSDQKMSDTLELNRYKRIFEMLISYAPDCEKCEELLRAADKDITLLVDNRDSMTEKEISEHKALLRDMKNHLQKQHQVVQKGFYLSIGLSMGVAIGVALGLTLFNNIGIGIAIGIVMGIAIGSGADARADKNGKSLF